MPFIHTKLNIPLDAEKEAVLKSRLGEAISIFPGKNEYWLMLQFSDCCRMWFRGYQSFPIAFVEVQLFGSADRTICEQMTKQICRIYQEELDLSPEHIYVKYEFVDEWGWNNENF